MIRLISFDGGNNWYPAEGKSFNKDAEGLRHHIEEGALVMFASEDTCHELGLPTPQDDVND